MVSRVWHLPGGPIAVLAVVAGAVLLIGGATRAREHPAAGNLKLIGPAPLVRPAHVATPTLRTARFADGDPVSSGSAPLRWALDR